MLDATVSPADRGRVSSVQVTTSVDPATVAGLVLGLGALVVAFLLDGGHLNALINPTAAMIVFGGTIGATLASFPYKQIFNLPRLIARTVMTRAIDSSSTIELLANLADTARRDGLLALEGSSALLGDRFMQRGIELVVDGADPETVREVLDVEIERMQARHAANYGVLEQMGGFAPTMGIIGTVMGLIHVLGSMEDASRLASAIAVAFIATLYGVASANLLWLPLANKLRSQSEQELAVRRLMTHGILAIQAGENPRVIRAKLQSFLSPGERKAAEFAPSRGDNARREAA